MRRRFGRSTRVSGTHEELRRNARDVLTPPWRRTTAPCGSTRGTSPGGRTPEIRGGRRRCPPTRREREDLGVVAPHGRQLGLAPRRLGGGADDLGIHRLGARRAAGADAGVAQRRSDPAGDGPAEGGMEPRRPRAGAPPGTVRGEEARGLVEALRGWRLQNHDEGPARAEGEETEGRSPCRSLEERENGGR